MKRQLLICLLFFASTSATYANGLLIPVEPDLPPLAMLNHHVDVNIEDQLAVTRVQQTFRNHTDRKLEANYVFPVPAGASVRNFTMWVNGRPMKGELLKADKARQIYTSIVRQTKNPAMLDYIGSDLLSLKIYPIPPKSDQKVEISFTTVAKKDHDLVEYVYPLKTDRMAAATLEEFRLTLKLKSQQPIGNLYSPTHQVTVTRPDDHQAVVQFEQYGSQLDRDFQLFYTHSGRDIGLTALEHRPLSSEDGYVVLLLSPRPELDQRVPRDIVFVLDKSGSMMQEKKMEQAKQALRHCLGELSPQDRFGLIDFATTVNRFRDELLPASEEHIKRAKGWVADQYAGGGTAIHEALSAALAMRPDNSDRMFTVLFLTDGQPTIGETDTDKILANIKTKNTSNTRIFTLGVGDNLNAVFMDQLAEQTRALSRYIRPGESLVTNVASFFNKINNPVLANLKLSTGKGVRLTEVYPPQLPDLFHGDQLVVLARYQGSGHVAIMLDGKIGKQEQKLVYELEFKAQTADKPFVEELWARRKVGYLLDQIRINGEKQELVDEVVRLAKNHGITTPYTSYLIMPDVAVEVASTGSGPAGRVSRKYYMAPAALAPRREGDEQSKLVDFAKRAQNEAGQLAGNRGRFQDQKFDRLVRSKKPAESRAGKDARERIVAAQQLKGALDTARGNYRNGLLRRNQVDKLGVDLAVWSQQLKCQSQVRATAVCNVASRNCMEIGGVWIDAAFTTSTPTVTVKAQSDAYFQILQRQPQMKEVFRLGNHVVWITPNGTGLVIDTTDGADQMTDREIDALFAAK
ncbi:MAG: VIT and VWA domain-containing protein [Pirellulaceae bacterium]